MLLMFALSAVFQVAQAQKKVLAIYESCTVYTGMTQYNFKDAKTNAPIQVIVSNMPEKGMLVPEVPKNLIDPSKNLEGIPGENPRMVGKKFNISYNAKAEILKVTPIK